MAGPGRALPARRAATRRAAVRHRASRSQAGAARPLRARRGRGPYERHPGRRSIPTWRCARRRRSGRTGPRGSACRRRYADARHALAASRSRRAPTGRTGAIVAAPTFGLPGDAGRRAQLGLPLLLDPRLGRSTLNALMRAGLDDGGAVRSATGSSTPSAAPRPDADHVRHPRRAAPHRDRAALARRLRRREARAHRQRGLLAVPARRARRVRRGRSIAYAKHAGPAAGDAAQTALKAIAPRSSRGVAASQDHGIWEMRGPERSFTASKVAAWTAIDRWIRAIEDYDLDEDKAPWVELRAADLRRGLREGLRRRAQHVHAVLRLEERRREPAVHPADRVPAGDDPRVAGTVKAIEEELMRTGWCCATGPRTSDDGLAGEEGVFLACSFWLASIYHLMGRTDDARRLFDKLAGSATTSGCSPRST